MSRQLTVDLFAEDHGHEEFLKPLIERIAKENNRDARIRVRSARGGHGRAIAEFKLYQRGMLEKGGAQNLPDLLIVAIDANCRGLNDARADIDNALLDEFRNLCLPAVPMPHIERWFLADLQAFHQIVGITPQVPKDKCERQIYKNILKQAVKDAGHPATLGGIEFARELAESLDFFRAGKSESGFKHFLDDTVARMKSV